MFADCEDYNISKRQNLPLAWRPEFPQFKMQFLQLESRREASNKIAAKTADLRYLPAGRRARYRHQGLKSAMY
jgi:hypothetical protein